MLNKTRTKPFSELNGAEAKELAKRCLSKSKSTHDAKRRLINVGFENPTVELLGFRVFGAIVRAPNRGIITVNNKK